MKDQPARDKTSPELNKSAEQTDMLEWALAPMRQARWRQASSRWATLRAAHADLPAVWIQAAICHRHLGEWEQAVTLLEAAIERFPKNPNGWLELAALKRETGHSKEAAAWIESAMSRFPNDLSVSMAAVEQAIFEERFDRAEMLNRRLRESFQGQLAPWRQYGELAMRQQKWTLALERWAEVRKRFPDKPIGFQKAAEAATELGDDRLARRLKLARDYGLEWLDSFSLPASQDVIKPPERRSTFQFVELVLTKAKFNLKSEASQNYLRYLWWVIDPLLYLSVFYLVFGFLLYRGGGENFVVYLLTGLVPFQWFAKTIQQSSNAIFAGRGVMNQVRVSPLFFPLVAIVQNAGKQTPVFVLLFGFLLLYGLHPGWHWFGLLPVIAMQLLLMSVLGCFLALLVPFVRDITNLIPTGIQFMLFCSGIFYSVDMIPEQWRSLFFINPMANLLYQYREILINQQWPDWSGMGWLLLGCLVGLALLIWFYRKIERDIPRVVAQ